MFLHQRVFVWVKPRGFSQNRVWYPHFANVVQQRDTLPANLLQLARFGKQDILSFEMDGAFLDSPVCRQHSKEC